jgi:hypothetical protein
MLIAAAIAVSMTASLNASFFIVPIIRALNYQVNSTTSRYINMIAMMKPMLKPTEHMKAKSLPKEYCTISISAS